MIYLKFKRFCIFTAVLVSILIFMFKVFSKETTPKILHKSLFWITTENEICDRVMHYKISNNILIEPFTAPHAY